MSSFLENLRLFFKNRLDTRWDWGKGFLIILYFILLSLVAGFGDNPLLWVLAWPNYLFPTKPFLAAVIQLVFVYLLASFVEKLLKGLFLKKKVSKDNKDDSNNQEGKGVNEEGEKEREREKN